MADPNGQKDNQGKPAEDAEPVVSKPYIMPVGIGHNAAFSEIVWEQWGVAGRDIVL